MRFTVDTEARTLVRHDSGRDQEMELYSREAFDALAHVWTKVGWQQKYSYRFSWFGRPIIQLPDDVLRIQELLYQLRPAVVVETGVAHGGSLVLYASLCRAMGHGRVIGVDIEIRPHNRAAIEAHELYDLIDLVEGDSTDPAIVNRVRELTGADAPVLVLLDSNHTLAHVARELEAYSPLVTPGSYLVVADGVMKDLDDVPNGRPEWARDNPMEAAARFLSRHDEFELVPPPQSFDESDVPRDLTYWPSGWLRRRG